MNSYELSRNWFDWAFENPEKINPNHSAILFFAIEHCNRLGWREKFGFPTQMAMDAVGIKKYDTYIRYFNDLVEWGFFKLVQKSVNQYSSNIISLQSASPKKGKALSKAILNHTQKQTESNAESNGSIDKPITTKPNNHKHSFDEFWDLYDKKVGNKDKLIAKFDKLSEKDVDELMAYIPKYKLAQPDKKYRKDPSTFLNNKSWKDEIIGIKSEPEKPIYDPTLPAPQHNRILV